MLDDIKIILKELTQLWQYTTAPIDSMPKEIKQIADKYQINLEDFDIYKNL